MNAILWLPRVVYKLYFLILFAGYLILGYPFFHWATVNEARFPIAFRRLNNWSKFLTFFSGIYVHKKGVGNLPKNQPYVLCANHSSYLDITIIYRVLDDYFVMMGKGEIRNWPLFNRFFTTGMNILVDRESRIGSHKALEEAKVALDKGHNVVVFPEGGIPDFIAPKMRGFKNGAFKMAIEKQVPIVPMTYQTNWKLLEGVSFFTGRAGPGICRVIIHKPIETKGLTPYDVHELRAKTRAIIAGPLEKYYA